MDALLLLTIINIAWFSYFLCTVLHMLIAFGSLVELRRNGEIERYSTDLRLGMTSSLVLVRSAVRAEVERLKVKKDGENG